MTGIEEFHREITSKNYKYLRPGIEMTFYDAKCIQVIDPYGKRIRFNEDLKPGGAKWQRWGRLLSPASVKGRTTGEVQGSGSRASEDAAGARKARVPAILRSFISRTGLVTTSKPSAETGSTNAISRSDPNEPC
jgi:Glyoxalase superfamily protein